VHSTQPWPYPASLMLGCVGEALPDGEGINLGHDPELHGESLVFGGPLGSDDRTDARWFPISFIKEMLARPQAGLQDAPPEGFKEVGLILGTWWSAWEC
jgi:NAD+ diphosphatase